MSETQQLGHIELPSGEDTATWESLLALNIGRAVTAEFIIGTDMLIRRSGTLYAVGADYIVLYDTSKERSTVCALQTIRFVTFYRQGSEVDVTEQPSEDMQPSGVTPVMGRAQAQAAFNYAKRKSRKLE